MEFRRVAIVMAGGSGERFWPLSRNNRPKQLLSLIPGEGTMMEQAIDRLLPVFDPADIFVITSPHLIEPISVVVPQVPRQNIIAEPLRRNTAGCLTYAAALLEAKYGDDPISIAVVTADHLISPVESFQTDVRNAMEIAERDGRIVTIGVAPTRPETGYGYIEALPSEPILSGGDATAVKRFHEKPNLAMAERYIQSHDFLWNSGMFFWTGHTFSDQLHRCSPIHGEVLDRLIPLIAGDQLLLVDETFAELPDISIDYALMERSDRIAVLRATFSWDDLGTWDAIGRLVEADENGNASRGDNVMIASSDCLIYNASKAVTVGLSGVKDLLVVVTDDAVLVCDRNQAQSVREIVTQLKATGSDRV